jgi:hypothetical protein
MASSTEPSSGIGSYSPISNLAKQYVEPVGQRLFLFVKTNPNCCLSGGVEALLKQKQDPFYVSAATNSTLAPVTAAATTTTGAGAPSSYASYPNETVSGADTSNTGSPGHSANDPFGFLTASSATPTRLPVRIARTSAKRNNNLINKLANSSRNWPNKQQPI